MSEIDTAKKPAPQDWHRADIKAALEKRGTSLDRLSRQHKFYRGAASLTLVIQWPRMERIIADTLGMQPQQIWPSRYHEDGSPKGPRRRAAFLKHSTAPAGSNVHQPERDRHGPRARAHHRPG